MPKAPAVLQGSPKHAQDSPQAKQQTWDRLMSQAMLCPAACSNSGHSGTWLTSGSSMWRVKCVQWSLERALERGNSSSHLSPNLVLSQQVPTKNPPRTSQLLCTEAHTCPQAPCSSLQPQPLLLPHSLMLGTKQGHLQDTAPRQGMAAALI